MRLLHCFKRKDFTWKIRFSEVKKAVQDILTCLKVWKRNLENGSWEFKNIKPQLHQNLWSLGLYMIWEKSVGDQKLFVENWDVAVFQNTWSEILPMQLGHYPMHWLVQARQCLSKYFSWYKVLVVSSSILL